MRLSILQRLSKFWAHIQYYKYEPSKPRRSEILRLDLNNQASWIENNVPEYDYNLYGDNYLGCSYEIDEDILQEYLDDRENIDTSGLIARQMPASLRPKLHPPIPAYRSIARINTSFFKR